MWSKILNAKKNLFSKGFFLSSLLLQGQKPLLNIGDPKWGLPYVIFDYDKG
jgi:hypothetical protein